MPIRFVNPAPSARRSTKKRGKLKGAAKKAFLAKMAAGRSKARSRRPGWNRHGRGRSQKAVRAKDHMFDAGWMRKRRRRKNTTVTVRSTRGVRKLPARPTGVPRPRPGSKPPGVSNPRRRRRRSTISTGGAHARRRPPQRRKRKMARRKLYGAAAMSHAKKRKKRRGARRRRRHNPARSTRRRRRKAAATAPRRRRRRRKAAAAAPRARRRRRRRVSRKAFAAYRKGHGRRRRRRVAHHFGTPRRRRRRRRRFSGRRLAGAMRAYGARRRNPRRRRSRGRRRYRRNPRPSTQGSMLRARRAIRNRYKTPLGRATQRRYRMRSNPGGVLIDTLKAAVPVAISLYGSRALSFGLSSRVPGLNRVPSQFQGTVMALALGAIGHFATKKIGRLAKYRGPIMLGLGLNLIDNVLAAFAPASVKSRIGLGDVYADGLGDYVQVDGAPPIDDNMTLSDYFEVGDYVEVGLEEELGATVEEELGLEEELGADAYLGGVQQSSMLAPVPRTPSLEAVPQRSFTQKVPRAGAGYDNPRNLYGGVFAGGFGG